MDFKETIKQYLDNKAKQDLLFSTTYQKPDKNLGKDTRNPIYVCPSNLKASHDKYVAKRKVKEMADKGKSYKKDKAKFLGLKFENQNIQISVLQDIEDFVEEGRELNHCVFKNQYYARDKSLILSAKVNGKRT